MTTLTTSVLVNLPRARRFHVVCYCAPWHSFSQGPIGPSTALAHSREDTSCGLLPIGLTGICGQGCVDEVGFMDVIVLCYFLLGPGISPGPA